MDAIVLNGSQNGGGGGRPTGVLQLGPGEYINRVAARHDGGRLYRVELHTNPGKSIAGGGNRGTETALDNIRVVMMGGRAGRYMDRLEVTYCADYEP